ncbi:MAG: PadR family transcriptional regulator [Streptomycetaceae bacterium]|nr:PadR family transcriptional regulator [Streptomycetaceae bacterium]
MPTSTYSILGLLSYARELSGFEVKKWADLSLRYFYASPATSQIYRELEKLEAAGLAASRVVPGESARSTRVYRLTDAGRTELKRWVEQAPVEPPMLRDSMVLRAWLGHVADPARLRELLEEHRRQLEQALAGLRRLEESSAGDPQFAFPELIAQWVGQQCGAAIEGVDVLVQGIDRISAEKTEEADEGADH